MQNIPDGNIAYPWLLCQQPSGIADFGKLLSYNEKHAPLKRNATAFLCSDLASGSTGEFSYVDGGFNTTALGTSEA